MYYFQLNDLSLFISNLKNLSTNFSMVSCVSFSIASTRSAAHSKLLTLNFAQIQAISKISILFLPLIFLNHFLLLNWKLSPFFGHHFKLTLIPRLRAVIISVLLYGCFSMPHPLHFKTLLVNCNFLSAYNVTWGVHQYWFLYFFFFISVYFYYSCSVL